jgi:hypothetical protein
MKKKLLFAAFTTVIALSAEAAQPVFRAPGQDACIPPVAIKYKVKYHWGLINTTAAYGTVRLEATGNSLTASLDGHSISWGGRQYTVSDTLKVITMPGRGPLYARQNVLYRAGRYSKPLVSLLSSPAYNPGDPANYCTISGQGTLSASPRTMEAVGISCDMLGIFYLFRYMDFTALQPGQTLLMSVNMPRTGMQHAMITYLGPDQYQDSPSYKVRFEYTYRGVRSGYPVTCQVERSSRIPLLISASLDIGRMEMIRE